MVGCQGVELGGIVWDFEIGLYTPLYLKGIRNYFDQVVFRMVL